MKIKVPNLVVTCEFTVATS